MGLDIESSNSKGHVLSLVQYCQRVACNHVDSISSLGDMSYRLVKPVLERCTAEQLLRLEQASPHLQRDSDEIWKTICFNTYPAIVERYENTSEPEPESWRDYYFWLREEEAKKLELVRIRMRSQRREAEERKKEREVKFTDRIPPLKRSRGWQTNVQPKTLFQKTRSEASKIQKNMYNARILPPMSTGKTYGVTNSSTHGTVILPPPQSGYSNRVTVNTVVRRPPMTSSGLNTASSSKAKEPLAPPPPPLLSEEPPQPTSDAMQTSPERNAPSHSHTSPNRPDTAQSRPPFAAKKDPVSSLFMPKHRAYSQRTR